MPVELYFGNRLEQLSEKLSGNLFEGESSFAQVFAAPVVIVPNQNLAKWLQLTLALQESVLMHVDFQYLEDGMWTMLESLDEGDAKPLRLDSDTLKPILLKVLQTCDPDDAELGPVLRYLADQEDGRPEMRAAKLWQLTEKLTQLFQEYEFHRSPMIDAWMDGQTGNSAMEACQRNLYLNVCRKVAELNEEGPPGLASLRDYSRTVLSRLGSPPSDSSDLRRIHVFGLSQISGFHLDLIGRLSPHYSIAIYALNPSREFWEDIRTPGEKQWMKRRGALSLRLQPEEIEAGELFSEVDQPLLSAWGKPGRESVRMLCALTDYDFHACYAPEVPFAGLLTTIQNNILNLDDRRVASQDTSLQIMACPSMYREVETAYNSILFNLEQDKNLQLTDIAVLVPDMGAYKPVFDAVFTRSPRVIAYNLVDSNAQMESAYAKGVLGILALARGRFTRKDVFDLMMNPCFMKRWNIDADQIRIWASWADQLGIFHSFDQTDKTRRGYAASDRYTWKQGLVRLRLGRLMTLPGVEDGPDRLRPFKAYLPFGDIHTGDRDLVDTFCLVVETLHRAVKDLTACPGTSAQWKTLFLGLCDRLLEIPETLKGEAAVKRSLIQAFENLAIYDNLTSGPNDPGFDLDLLTEFVSSHLGGIAGGVGDYLTSGITISALQPMRPIPFSMVYILGMGEGNFPGRAETSSLDLRLARRQIGDITTPERNSYLFLEILLAVREKLYITYVARDLQKDRLIQPCSVVNQLRRYVEQDILAAENAFAICQIPLKGSSERYLDAREITPFCDVMVNYAPADRIACLRSGGRWDAFLSEAGPEDRTTVMRFNPDLSLFIPETPEGIPSRISLSVGQLRAFLENPARQSVRHHLGLYEDDETIEDLVLTEDEPFFSVFPTDYRLKTETLDRWVEQRCDDQELAEDRLFERIYACFSLKNQVPEEPFALPDKAELSEYVRRCTQALTPVLDSMKRAGEGYRALIMGDPGSDFFQPVGSFTLRRLEPVTLSVAPVGAAPCEVTLSGRIPWVWSEGEGTWHTLVITGAAHSPKRPNKYALTPLLFFMLCLCDRDNTVCSGAMTLVLHVLFKDEVVTWRFDLNPDRARIYLTDLLTDYLGAVISPWLPLETVDTILPKIMSDADNPDPVREFNLAVAEAFEGDEDPMTVLARPALPGNAFELAERRLGPLLPDLSEIKARLTCIEDTPPHEARP